MSTDYDYSSMLNAQKTANANALFGSSNNTNIGGGISGDMLQQWSLLGANSSAYKKLLAMQESGETAAASKGYNAKVQLNSDKLFNDHYDPATGKVKAATYTPSTNNEQKIEEDATTGDVLSDMRALALAASGNPDSLNSAHYNYFETLRKNIASNFVGGSKSSSSSDETETGEAKEAKVSTGSKFRYLEDDQSFTLAGAKGEKKYTFAVGTSLEDMAKAINADSSATGIKAEAVTNDDGTVTLNLASTETGKDAFVRVDQGVGDLFAEAGSSASAKGADATTGKTKTETTGDDIYGAMVAGVFYGKVAEDTAFTLSGANGSQSFTFEHGTSAKDIVSAINEATAKTGVKAEVIYNDDGDIEGIGLLTEKAGSGNFIQIEQTKGDLFAAKGKTVSVAGSSKSSSGSGDSPVISSLSDLGRVKVGDNTYSFADLAPGGKASLEKNPDAALAVIDQAIKDIASGLAKVEGFDPSEIYVPGVTDSKSPAASSNNTLEYQNPGSSALSNWIGKYEKS